MPRFSIRFLSLSLLTGAFAAGPILAGLALIGIVVTAAYMLWMLQRVRLGRLSPKYEKMPDADTREVVSLAPLMALQAQEYRGAELDLLPGLRRQTGNTLRSDFVYGFEGFLDGSPFVEYMGQTRGMDDGLDALDCRNQGFGIQDVGLSIGRRRRKTRIASIGGPDDKTGG